LEFNNKETMKSFLLGRVGEERARI
jgi:hypothetical protein